MRKLLVAVLAVVPALAFAGITNSAHDFATNTAPIYFTSGARLCSFCHTAHHAPSTQGLWNRQTANLSNSAWGANAFTSAGTALPANTAALLFPTRQCLSCHDGSTAINELWTNASGYSLMGNTVNGPGAGVLYSAADANAGGGTGFYLNTTAVTAFTSLNGTHPVSTEYRSAKVVQGEYGTPDATVCVAGIANCTAAGGHAAKIFPNSVTGAAFTSGFSVECGSCHDPHYGPGTVAIPTGGTGTGSTIFLRFGNGFSICLSCHIK